MFDERWDWPPDPLVYAYFCTIRPGVVKGWALHREHEDRYFVVQGEMEVTLYDDREDSPTRGMLVQVYLTEFDRRLMNIPAGIWHADRNVGSKDVLLVNFPTQRLRPREPRQVPPAARHRADPALVRRRAGMVSPGLPAHPEPRVSVLIAAFNPPTFGRCLRALAEHLTGEPSCEVIATLNGPSEALLEAAGGVEGLRTVDTPINLGMAAGANAARAVARGELLVLVQDDAEVEAGWLEALVEAADANGDAGAVGGLVDLAGRRARADRRAGALGRLLAFGGRAPTAGRRSGTARSRSRSTTARPARCSCAPRPGTRSAGSTTRSSPPATWTPTWRCASAAAAAR